MSAGNVAHSVPERIFCYTLAVTSADFSGSCAHTSIKAVKRISDNPGYLQKSRIVTVTEMTGVDPCGGTKNKPFYSCVYIYTAKTGGLFFVQMQ